MWRRGSKLARPWYAKGLRACWRKFSHVLERAVDYSCHYSAIGSSFTVQGYFSLIPASRSHSGPASSEMSLGTRYAPGVIITSLLLASAFCGRKQAFRKAASSTSSLTRGCGSLNGRRITQTIHHTKVGVAQPLNSSLAGFFFPFNQRTALPVP
jgi:hypothetical protein